MWEKSKNLIGIGEGNYRSILGYAGESLAIGRALICGYNLFFKAWRDAKYDAVLDAEGILFRVEIKQTSTDTGITVVSGGRSGQQINREVETREKVLSRKDCDFLIGVHSMSGKCWVVPVEVIEIFGKKMLNFYLLEPFKEKWKVFIFDNQLINNNHIKSGFSQLQIEEIKTIAKDLNIELPDEFKIKTSENSNRYLYLDEKEWLVIQIWLKIYSNL